MDCCEVVVVCADAVFVGGIGSGEEWCCGAGGVIVGFGVCILGCLCMCEDVLGGVLPSVVGMGMFFMVWMKSKIHGDSSLVITYRSWQRWSCSACVRERTRAGI